MLTTVEHLGLPFFPQNVECHTEAAIITTCYSNFYLLCQFFISIPPENIKKQEVFSCSQGAEKGNIGLIWIKSFRMQTYEHLR